MEVKGIPSTMASYQSGEGSAKVLNNVSNAGNNNLAMSNQKNPVLMESKSEDGQRRDTNADMNRMKHAMDQVNDKLKFTKTRCEFSYHEVVNRVSIKVLDKETNEVIREIPPEETYKALEKIWEIAGLLVDEKR